MPGTEPTNLLHSLVVRPDETEDVEGDARPASARARWVASRLFLTCWLVFVLHFATDIVREHYLAFSLAEDYSFRVDRYLGLHNDIFETPGRGAHIGNNPGVSMLGAIPYWVFKPVIHRTAALVNDRRQAVGGPITAVYNEPRRARVEFYRKVRARGLDVQFGLAALVMQVFLMAPLSALAALVMYRLLLQLRLRPRKALLYAFLYALGTPVLFRTAFLNQNLLIAHLVLFGFVAVWRPGGFPPIRERTGWLVAGFCGGFSLLSDYSGAVVLAWLGLYVAAKAWQEARWPKAIRSAAWYSVGAVGPMLLLLFYQWRSFGSPWYPGQHYMPPVDWIDIGYQGVGLPEFRLFWMLLFDLRFGLFVVCPLLALGVVGAAIAAAQRTCLPRREAVFLLAFSAAFVLFFSAVQYTQIQWIAGIRYIVPVIPALFLLAIPALERLRPGVLFVVVVAAFAESWCLSMVRATYVSDSIAAVFLGGFQLPWMNVLVKMAPQYFPFMAERASALPLFTLLAVLVAGVWWRRRPEAL
jgi:hypothetical protein